jgi:hypothetical protein
MEHRTFYIDAEGVEVTVRERPDVARLVAQGRASHACVGAEGIAVAGVELPLVETFLFVDEMQLFWWPDATWTPERVAAFFALLMRLLTLAPAAYLRPDPRYPATTRRTLVSSSVTSWAIRAGSTMPAAGEDRLRRRPAH